MMRTEKNSFFSEMCRLVRGAMRAFLTHLGAVFSKRGRSADGVACVGKNGQPPLPVLSGAFAQFEWYRGVFFVSSMRRGFFVFVNICLPYGRKEI